MWTKPIKQKAPYAIKELDIEKDQLVVINSAYKDIVGNFKLEVMNQNFEKSAWFLYENASEAVIDGWEV